MANTYTQLYVHIVFSVYFREHLIAEANREEGIIANHKCKLLLNRTTKI